MSDIAAPSSRLPVEKTLTPRQIVTELDKYIIGQQDAKKAVAIALRNRWRRQQIPEALQEEVTPKNIIMMGPTGVGKTEIARRLAKLAQAPFMKVEATKFTEVGYVGRDVDSMVRDLAEMAVQQSRQKAQEDVREKASRRAEERLLDLLVKRERERFDAERTATAPQPAPKPETKPVKASPTLTLPGLPPGMELDPQLLQLSQFLTGTLSRNPELAKEMESRMARHPLGKEMKEVLSSLTSAAESPLAARDESPDSEGPDILDAVAQTTETAMFDEGEVRTQLAVDLASGDLDDDVVEMDLPERMGPMIEIFSSSGIEEMGFNMKDLFGNMFGGNKTKTRRISIADAREALIAEESQKLIDMEDIVKSALRQVEQSGIIFIDEIDKVAGRRDGGHGGPDVSREGVQRDLLPLVEGSTIMTKYGPVRTNHILFIAAGAFHISKPSDLIPEMQGRFPIRVELTALSTDDFVRILTEPENSLIKQYRQMIATEGVDLSFSEAAVRRIAEIAFSINERSENIGARRLYTVMEKLLEEVSFESPDMRAGSIPVTPQYIDQRLTGILADEDLSKYIL